MDPFAITDQPEDPRGGFNSSNEGCIKGTAWGGAIELDGSDPEFPNPFYQSHTTGGTGGSVTVAE